jgi:hypothetical protein
VRAGPAVTLGQKARQPPELRGSQPPFTSPQGDVLFEYLEALPMLKPGVFVHIHDIFTPRDYLQEWIVNETKLWNEQYLLEAFLSFNREFRIIGAVNFLTHHHPAVLAERFPILEMEIGHREPGSFWIVRQ